MRKVAAVVTAVMLAACASTRQERAAEFQRELPQLVAACNGWIRLDPRLDGPTIQRDGLTACNRLSVKRSLHLADPAIVSAYQRLAGDKAQSQALWDSGRRGTHAIPMPLPQVQ